MTAAPAMRALLIALSLVYPLLVYCGHGTVSPGVFVLTALLLIAIRYALASASTLVFSHRTIPIAGAALLIVSFLDPSLAALAYPSLISFAFALAFGLSLWRGPSLIERFARLRRPDLPDAAEAYCVIVTLLWTIWLVANGLIAAALALSRDMELWLLWTNLINYLISAGLFGGEWLFRRIRRLPV